ncbi:MAG: TonB-dependent receptor [Candidatus Eisenbacteria bacterium]
MSASPDHGHGTGFFGTIVRGIIGRPSAEDRFGVTARTGVMDRVGAMVRTGTPGRTGVMDRVGAAGRTRHIAVRLICGLAPVALSSVAQAGPTRDEEPRFWPDVVDTLEVVRSLVSARELLEDSPGFSTWIQLGPAVPASRDLADLIDEVEGVHVNSYGGIGAFSTASIRGSSASQVQVVLDGVPLTSARDGFTNLGLIPLQVLDHAIVHRGAQTLSLAGPPTAGVIQLFSPRASTTPLRLGFSLGSFDTRTTFGQWGTSKGPWGLLLTGQRRSTDGDFAYLDRKGTPANTDDDEVTTRSNNDHIDESFLWKTSYAPNRSVSLAYTGQRTDRDGGVPGTETIQTETTRYRSTRDRHQISIDARTAIPTLSPAWGRLSGSVQFFRDDTSDHFSNLDGEVGLGLADTESDLEKTGWETRIALPLVPAGVRIEAVHARDTETWTPYDRLHDIREYGRERSSRTTITSGRWTGLDDHITFDASYRWDRATDNYDGPTVFGRPPAAGPERTQRFEAPTFGFRLGLGHGLSLQGNRGRFLRWPTFPELFGQNGVQDGNPKLEPESGLQWDLGLGARGDHVGAVVAYFESVTDDEILLLQNSQRTVKAQNVDRTWARGVESSLETTASLPNEMTVRLSTNVTWQEAIDRGTGRAYRGKAVPYLPSVEGHGAVSLDAASWSAEYGITTRSDVYRDRYNSEEKQSPGHTLHRVSLQKGLFRGRAGLRFEVENLFDHRSQDVEGYPLPGRVYFLELSLEPFGSSKP